MSHIENMRNSQSEKILPVGLRTITHDGSGGSPDLLSSQIWDLIQQVSNEVSNYNQGHPKEMLPKTPQDIMDQFMTGSSVILAVEVNGHWELVHHCTSYDLLTANQATNLGMQVVELGTAITAEKYRTPQWRGIGSEAMQQLITKLGNKYGENWVGIATIKQFVTGNMFRHVNGQAVSWGSHPYLAYLTDSCAGLSPTETGSACIYRRQPEESGDIALQSVTKSRGSNMACTLITIHADRAHMFENMARSRHWQLSGSRANIIAEGTIDTANPHAWKTMDRFYKAMDTQNISWVYPSER